MKYQEYEVLIILTHSLLIRTNHPLVACLINFFDECGKNNTEDEIEILSISRNPSYKASYQKWPIIHKLCP